MSRLGQLLQCSVLAALWACSTSHGGNDTGGPDNPTAGQAGAAALAGSSGATPAGGAGSGGGSARAGGSEPGAGNTAGEDGSAAGAGDASPLVTPEERLQVWLGKVRGGLYLCEDEQWMEPVLREYRALLLLQLDERGQPEAATLTLGEGPPLVPAAKPDDFYPPVDTYPGYANCPQLAPVSGFEYLGYNLRLSDSRFQMAAYLRDYFGEWCSLQQSYPASDAALGFSGEKYYCIDTSDLDTTAALIEARGDEQSHTSLCLEQLVCDCGPQGCTANHVEPAALDVVVEDNRMEGRLLLPQLGGSNEVLLQRM